MSFRLPPPDPASARPAKAVAEQFAACAPRGLLLRHQYVCRRRPVRAPPPLVRVPPPPSMCFAVIHSRRDPLPRCRPGPTPPRSGRSYPYQDPRMLGRSSSCY
ncbi:hypothetical protein D1007_37319 [Hordeum vulgare]|nr:hypothetical protein D1007_37319 [Hordeum vulgare]